MQRDEDAVASLASGTIAETDHSVIEKCYHDGQVAVLKRAREPQDPRAVNRWRNEVKMLQSIGHHVSITSVIEYRQFCLHSSINEGLPPDPALNSRVVSRPLLNDCVYQYNTVNFLLHSITKKQYTSNPAPPKNMLTLLSA